MKTTIKLTSILCCSFLLLQSCNSSKETIAQRKQEIRSSRINSGNCFVQLTDGTIKHFTTLRLVTGPFIAPHLLGDGKVKIRPKNIVAYQTADHYAISQQSFISGRKSFVSTETLPGFAVRIARGKINVYSKKYYNGVAAVDEYFIQKGDEGQIFAYTSETINQFIEDDPEALNFFMAKMYDTPKSKKIAVSTSYVNNDKKLRLKK